MRLTTAKIRKLIKEATLLWDWECFNSFDAVKHDYDHPWSKNKGKVNPEDRRKESAMILAKHILDLYQPDKKKRPRNRSYPGVARTAKQNAK